MTHQNLIERLIQGNERFISQKTHGTSTTPRTELVDGQQPYAIILSCADSRVVPEYIFDAGLGELFVVRVAGNIANQSSIASIEYAVANLNTQLILVMGHQNCGAVAAALSQVDAGHNLNHLIDHIQPVIHHFEEDKNTAKVIMQNAKQSADDLIEKSEIISKAIQDQQLKIRSAYYHLDTGRVTFMD